MAEPTIAELRIAYGILDRLDQNSHTSIVASHLWETKRELANEIVRRETRS